MDLEPSLKYAVDRIKDALNHYASSKGWTSNSYHVFMIVNKKWGTISAELVANAFERERIHRFEYLDEVMDFLEADLKDEPEIYESLGLLLSPGDSYSFSLDRDYG